MEILIVVVLVLAFCFWLVRISWKRITVFETERGLLYRQGKFVSLLEPGQYWYFAYHTSITKVDIRQRYVSLVGQEILSSDNVSLKVSLTISYQYSDLATAVNQIQNVDQAVYLEVQQVVRELLGERTIDEILGNRAELSQQLFELTLPRLAPLGVSLKSMSIKDITFSGELKKIFAEVIRAQKEGVAALERARGETAALRNLANAAKMMDGNPALLQLRLIQALGSAGGNTVVFSTSPAEQWMPIKRPE